MPQSNTGRVYVLWRRISRRCAANRILVGELALVWESAILVQFVIALAWFHLSRDFICNTDRQN